MILVCIIQIRYRYLFKIYFMNFVHEKSISYLQIPENWKLLKKKVKYR